MCPAGEVNKVQAALHVVAVSSEVHPMLGHSTLPCCVVAIAAGCYSRFLLQQSCLHHPDVGRAANSTDETHIPAVTPERGVWFVSASWRHYAQCMHVVVVCRISLRRVLGSTDHPLVPVLWLGVGVLLILQ